jgi:hypothetical protein
MLGLQGLRTSAAKHHAGGLQAAIHIQNGARSATKPFTGRPSPVKVGRSFDFLTREAECLDLTKTQRHGKAVWQDDAMEECSG